MHPARSIQVQTAPTSLARNLAHEWLKVMKEGGAPVNPDDLEWDAIVRADTLVNRPPPMLSDLKGFLGFLDKSGLVSMAMERFLGGTLL